MATQSAAVHQISVPPQARSLSTLARIDYADAFVVETESAAGRTPEEWARGILEDAPVTVRSALLSGWSALGLKLGSPRSERCVLGWPVKRKTGEFVLLSAGSRVGMPAELLVKRHERGLLFCTFVRHGNPAARVMWAATEPVHVSVVRRVLAGAVNN